MAGEFPSIIDRHIDPVDAPQWWEAISREAERRREPPHKIIEEHAKGHFVDLHDFDARTFSIAHPEADRGLARLALDYTFELDIRELEAAIEQVWLREEVKRCPASSPHHRDARDRLAGDHRADELILSRRHGLDLRILHHDGLKESLQASMPPGSQAAAERIRDLQTRELDNLAGRHEAQTLRLAAVMTKERDDFRQRVQARLAKTIDRQRTDKNRDHGRERD